MTPIDRERPFEKPWQAQAFALVVALQDRGLVTPGEWAAALGARVAASDCADGSDYFECWVAALADLLAAKDVATDADVQSMTAAWQDAAARTPHGRPILLS